MNKKKNKEKSMKKIMIKLIIKTIIIIIMTSMIFTCFGPYYVYEEDLPDILNLPKEEIKIETKTTIEPFVLKDPYRMEIYTLSNKTMEQFIKNPSKKFNIEWYERKKGWYKHGWYNTPFDTLHNVIIKSTLSFNSFVPELPPVYKKIKKALNKEGSFYAFYYLTHKKYSPGEKEDFDFFHLCFILLNKDNHKLYIITF